MKISQELYRVKGERALDWLDWLKERNISLVSSFLSYREPRYTQYGVVELFRQVGMCQVPLDLAQAIECVGVFAVIVVSGWALSHVVVVCWGAPHQMAEGLGMIGLGLALFTSVILIHLWGMTTLQKATAVANGYHGSATRRCNEA